MSTDTRDLWAWSQVSHHPPSAAHYVFSKHGWSLWQEITIASKFRGKYLSIMPLGEQGQKDALASEGNASPPRGLLDSPWPILCPQSLQMLLLVLRSPGSWVGGAGRLGPSLAGYDF